jgi:PTS system mannose-specific IIA component
MIGLLVVTHGELGKELVHTVEMITGPQEQLVSVTIDHTDDVPSSAERIAGTFDQVDEGEGVIIFTDLLGGTPSNVSLTFLNRPSVEVISGVNLPMLLQAVSCRASLPMKEVVVKSVKSGKEGVTAANLLLGKSREG